MALRRLANSLKAPFLRVGRMYNETAERNPLGTGVVTTVLKTSAADLFAQTVGWDSSASGGGVDASSIVHRCDLEGWWR